MLEEQLEQSRSVGLIMGVQSKAMKHKTLWAILGIIILVASASSGWAYNAVRTTQDTKNRELATLQATFAQQYGGQAVVKQMVSPDRVYAAIWVDTDGITHVSWNIGGLWVTVYSSTAPTPSP